MKNSTEIAGRKTDIRHRLERGLFNALRDELNRDNWSELYVLKSSEVKGLTVHPRLGGMTHPDFVEMTREIIGDKYRGPGHGMLIVDHPAMSEAQFIAIGIHEAAHIAETLEASNTDNLGRVLDCTSNRRECRTVRPANTFFELVKSDPRSWTAHSGNADSEHLGHGIEFVRILIHLAFRMVGFGFEVAPNLMFNWPNGPRGFEAYFDALQRECTSREFSPISEIRASPMPKKFVSLWDIDHRLKSTACLLTPQIT